MRSLALRALAAGVAVVLVCPVLAQQPGGRGGRGGFGFGGGQPDSKTLLLNKSVQDELKLSDDQKADLQKVREKQMAAFQKIRDAGDDADKRREIMQSAHEETVKDLTKWKESNLKADQSKRLKQIELQVGGVQAFTEADVAKELKLTDKQTSEIKDIADGLKKDVQDLAAGSRGDREKMRELGKKVEGLNKEATDKVTGILTDDQKSTWKTMVGDKFDYKPDQFGGRGGKGKGKGGQNQNKAD